RDRNNCVRAAPAIARITSRIKGYTNSIPITPWFAREHVNCFRHFHVGALHGLEQDGPLQCKLRLVIRMLIVATAASSEVTTARHYPLRDGGDDYFCFSGRIFPLVLGDSYARQLAGQCERYKNRLAIQVRKKSSAVERLLYLQYHRFAQPLIVRFLRMFHCWLM